VRRQIPDGGKQDSNRDNQHSPEAYRQALLELDKVVLDQNEIVPGREFGTRHCLSSARA